MTLHIPSEWHDLLSEKSLGYLLDDWLRRKVYIARPHQYTGPPLLRGWEHRQIQERAGGFLRREIDGKRFWQRYSMHSL